MTLIRLVDAIPPGIISLWPLCLWDRGHESVELYARMWLEACYLKLLALHVSSVYIEHPEKVYQLLHIFRVCNSKRWDYRCLHPPSTQSYGHSVPRVRNTSFAKLVDEEPYLRSFDDVSESCHCGKEARKPFQCFLNGSSLLVHPPSAHHQDEKYIHTDWRWNLPFADGLGKCCWAPI